MTDIASESLFVTMTEVWPFLLCTPKLSNHALPLFDDQWRSIRIAITQTKRKTFSRKLTGIGVQKEKTVPASAAEPRTLRKKREASEQRARDSNERNK